MNDAANQHALVELLKYLGDEPQTLDELWQARSMLWQDLGWEQPQLKLWLYCQPGLVRTTDSDGVERFGQESTSEGGAPNLSEEIAKIVQGNGKPLPLAQLKNRLPAGLLATDPMLKAAIDDHPRLQMMGPMVKFV